MGGRARQYQGPADRELLRSFLVSMRVARGRACWHSGDLAWRFFLHSLGHDLAETVRLWFDNRDRLQAFAIVTPRSREANLLFDLQVHPRACSQELLAGILGWIESLAVTAPAPRLLATDTGIYDVEAEQAAALQARGFEPYGDGALLLARPLEEPIPPPALPPGFRLRPVAGLPEGSLRAAAHRDAFGSSRVTDAAYLQLMRTPGYAPGWDLVAEAPDGSLAAFCLIWLDPSGTGEFEPVGTRPAYRRLGLARALLLHGLRRLAEAGASSAIVGPVDVEDAAALALYRSAGFEAVHHVSTYIREWPAPAGEKELPAAALEAGSAPLHGPRGQP